MIYRGYNIRTVDAIDLQRHNYNEHKTDFCDGVYVELYDQADDGLTERIGDTTFAVGYPSGKRRFFSPEIISRLCFPVFFLPIGYRLNVRFYPLDADRNVRRSVRSG